jgi:hypothetical protein
VTGLIGEQESQVLAAPVPPIGVVTPSRSWPSWLPGACTFLAVAGVIAVVLWQMHLSLLLTNTTTTGGDTGSHFVMPAFLKSHLLPSGRLTGWDPSWYAGYPIYTYYFVVPDLFAALLSYLIPYGIAFKLMTVLGSVLTPVGAWACGRLFRLRAPGPAALAAATLPFLFDYSWTIYGGNLFSTLAGEYAFSLGVPLALLFLGLFARGLRTGRGRGVSAVVLALCILTHIVPAMLALAGGVVLVGLELLGDKIRSDDGVVAERSGRWRLRRLFWGSSTMALGLLLSGWWLAPFGLDHAYSTQMGYTNVTAGASPGASPFHSGFPSLFFPTADLWAVIGAGVAVLVAVALRSRFGLLFSVLGVCSLLAVRFDPQGALYNVRLLPLWFLCLYLLVGWLVAVGLRGLVVLWRDRRRHFAGLRSPPVVHHYRFVPAALSGPLVALLGALVVVVSPFVLPSGTLSALHITPGANQVTNWSTWNYQGFEGAPAYPEFKALMATMSTVGHEHGCGRAMWEYDASENRFGTPEALMDLAYFTGGCVDSMEGLLFESSASTPWHFLNQAEFSPSPSEPMVGLPYGPVDVPLGVQHLQLYGVRYLMATSPTVVDAAKADPSLKLLATTGPWHSVDNGKEVAYTWDVFLVEHSAPAVGLHDLPAVLKGVGQSQPSWLPVAEPWYANPSRWAVELSAGGPASWPRVTAGERPPAVPVAAAKVTHIEEGTDTISFDVDRTGTPVLVKTSYFPNWVATGAQGPWRVTPNLMVVVPTAKHVTLSYTEGTAGRIGFVLTAVGVVLLLAGYLVERRRGARRSRRRRPEPATGG